jgi:hypothetical protein
MEIIEHAISFTTSHRRASVLIVMLPSGPLPFGSPTLVPGRHLGEAIITLLSRPRLDRHPALIVPSFETIQSGAPLDPSALAGVQLLSAGHVWILQRLFVCLTAYGEPHGQRRNDLR